MLIDRAKHVGWVPPQPHQIARARARATPMAKAALPPAAPTSDNSSLCISLDQGRQGSCTANAWAQCLAMEMAREGKTVFTPSRRYNYWLNRNLDGNAATDSGASVGGAFEVGAGLGVASEIVCPYDDQIFSARPGPETDRDAYDRRGELNVNYFPVEYTVDTMADAIERVLTSGRGVAFGVSVTVEFCSILPSGVVQAPQAGEQIAGGHALTAVGHNRAGGWFLVKNSWGDWGEPGQPPGCFRMSYAYMLTASDLWFDALSTGGL